MGYPAELETIDVVFDGPPGHEAGRFIETEDRHGKSIGVGRWVERADGYWALRLEVNAATIERASSQRTPDPGESMFPSPHVSRGYPLDRDERDAIRAHLGDDDTSMGTVAEGRVPHWMVFALVSLLCALALYFVIVT